MIQIFYAFVPIYLCISECLCTLHTSTYSNLQRISELQSLQSYQLSNPLVSSDPQILEYNECILQMQSRNTRSRSPSSIFGPFFLYKVEQVPIKLSCSPCVPPDSVVSWTRLSFESVQKEVQRSDDDGHTSSDFTISSPTSDLSTYYCSWFFNKTEILDFMWTVEIVPSLNLQKVSSRNWTRPPPTSFEGIKISTHVEEWSPCSQCGVVGKRHRVAYCSVKRSEHPESQTAPVTSWEALEMYPRISCTLFLNLHPEIGSLNQQASQALSRRSQVLVGYCKLPCTHYSTKFQAWQEDLSNSTHPVFQHIYSKPFDESWEYHTEEDNSTSSKKRLTMSQLPQLLFGLKDIPFSKDYIPEILSLTALLTLQLFIFIQIYRNRRSAK